jgi:hypothetical protein
LKAIESSSEEIGKLYKLTYRFIGRCVATQTPQLPGTHEQKLQEAYRFVRSLNVQDAQNHSGIHYEAVLRDADTISINRIDDKSRYNNAGMYCVLKIVEIKKG